MKIIDKGRKKWKIRREEGGKNGTKIKKETRTVMLFL